jgi:hypothetical protein
MNIEELTKLYKSAIKAVISAATEKGIFPSLPEDEYLVQWMEPKSETSSTGKHAIRKFRSFSLLQKSLPEFFKNNPEVLLFNKAAQAFTTEHGKFNHFFAKDSIATRQGETLLKEYFLNIDEMKVNDELISRTLREFETAISSEEEEEVLIYQVQTFSATEPFYLEQGIEFRPITMDDIFKYDRTDLERFQAPRWINLNDWICTIKKSFLKREAGLIDNPLVKPSHNNLYDLIDYVALALALASKGKATFYMLHKTNCSPFLRNGWSSGGLEIKSRRSGDKTNLNADMIKKFQQIFTFIRTLGALDQFKEIELPIRRLRTSSERNNPGDHLIDCVIGLENLLAPDKGEATYKFSIRGAALLPDSFGSQEERFKLMKDIYKKRSDFVHGAANAKEGIEELCEKSEMALIEVLLWYLKAGSKITTRKKIVNELDVSLIIGGENFRNLH